jgi:hypothetical protein
LEKRLAAPVWVFNLGIVFSISAGQSITESALTISEPLWEQGYPGRKADQISISQERIYRHLLALARGPGVG